jgi:hypothetical protein
VQATAHQILQPLIGTLTRTGQGAGIGRSVSTLVGTLTLAGVAPLRGLGIPATTGTLTATGLAPQLAATGHAVLMPATGALSLTGQTPLLTFGFLNFPIQLAPATPLTLTGVAPTVRMASGLGPQGGGSRAPYIPPSRTPTPVYARVTPTGTPSRTYWHPPSRPMTPVGR